MHMVGFIKKLFASKRIEKDRVVKVYSNRSGSSVARPINKATIEKGAKAFVDRYESVISDLARE